MLNMAWGTVHSGMCYTAFEQIGLPVGAVDEPNPAHALEFARYSSEQVAVFCRAQADVLRRHAPGVPITHNFMAGSYEFDHYTVAAELDFASFDSYPLGDLIHGPLPQPAKARWLRTGHPDYQGFHCDMYRHQGKGRLWITEQQPGPVNWADHNPSPAEGAVRLWTWLAFAHGAEAVLFFRWRQARVGQEQFHSALRLPDGTADRACREIRQVALERTRLPPSTRASAQVALVVDYPSRWATRILPQGRGYKSAIIAAEWYRTVRELGVDLDVIGPESDLTPYSLVLIPDMMIANPAFVEALATGAAIALIGPRSGSRTADFQVPADSPPGVFRTLIDLRVRRVESLPGWHSESVEYGARTYSVALWREWVESNERVLGRFLDPPWAGSPAILQNERATYLAMLPQGNLLQTLMMDLLQQAGLACHPTGADLRITHRGDLGFAFNFGPQTARLPGSADREFLVGGSEVGPSDLAIWRDPSADQRSGRE